METLIVHLKNDLRVHDNQALFLARQKTPSIVPVYILPEGLGGAARAWLHYSLQALAISLKSIGLTLILKRGDEGKALAEVKKESGAQEVFLNKPNLLYELGNVRNLGGKPYQVFTPFWKAVQYLPIEKPLAIPAAGGHTPQVSSLHLEDLDLHPSIPWDKGFWNMWEPGEGGAWKRVKAFLKGPIEHYGKNRDFPFLEEGVSHLSPHLHFGEISARALAEKVSGYPVYTRQIVWREFAHHLLYHFPQTVDQPLREEFKNFPWVYNKKFLKAWQRGETGYPIVDAGMRELWQTGWMHNRVRMIVGSFLVKDLLLYWEEGAKWFMDTLVDADVANNTFGWQWVAGCGADAAPYFRIFNPTLQGQKFDPDGLYVKHYCPELDSLPPKLIHTPWLSPTSLKYPKPIVDHAIAKERALAAFHALKQ